MIQNIQGVSFQPAPKDQHSAVVDTCQVIGRASSGDVSRGGGRFRAAAAAPDARSGRGRVDLGSVAPTRRVAAAAPHGPGKSRYPDEGERRKGLKGEPAPWRQRGQPRCRCVNVLRIAGRIRPPARLAARPRSTVVRRASRVSAGDVDLQSPGLVEKVQVDRGVGFDDAECHLARPCNQLLAVGPLLVAVAPDV